MADLSALDLSQRPPRVKWTDDMRKVLCCLVKYYKRDKRDKTAFPDIFYSLFQQDLIKSGITNGKMVGWARLESQWWDMKKHGDHIWGDVHCSGFDREPWLPVLNKIEGAAAALDLRLAEKEYDDIDSSQFVYENRVRQSPTQQQPQDTFTQNVIREELVNNTAQPDPSEQSLSAIDSPLVNAGGKLCIFCSQGHDQEEEIPRHGVCEDKPPRLLYRWWNVNSQGVNRKDLFIAGLFMDPNTLIYPFDSISNDQFHQQFLSHISRTHVPSPFISTFVSALAPVHRALREQEGATVSIIDSTKLKPQSKIFSAKEIVKKNSVRIQRSRYDGRGEYLIWGSVPNDAIICSFKITMLCGIAAEDFEIKRLLQLDAIAAFENAGKRLHQALKERDKGLNQRTGAAVGRLLFCLGVPSDYYKDVSERLAWSWRIKTNKDRYAPSGDFEEGVDLGFRREYIPPSPSPSPVAGFEGFSILFESGSDSDSDDDEEVDTPDSTNDEDDDVFSSRGITVNPIIQTVFGTNRVFPFIDLEERSDTPFPRGAASIARENDVEEESNMASLVNDGDFDFFDEQGKAQQEISTDQFANDRARVKSALEKFGPRR